MAILFWHVYYQSDLLTYKLIQSFVFFSQHNTFIWTLELLTVCYGHWGMGVRCGMCLSVRFIWFKDAWHNKIYTSFISKDKMAFRMCNGVFHPWYEGFYAYIHDKLRWTNIYVEWMPFRPYPTLLRKFSTWILHIFRGIM